EQERRHKQEQQIKRDERAPADEAFHFAPEGEEHVHLDREPDYIRGRMHECVGGDLPKTAAKEHLCAVETEEAENPGNFESKEKASDDHACDMHGEEQRRDVNRIAAYPTNRSIVIRGRDAEHTNSKGRSVAKCKPPSSRH